MRMRRIAAQPQAAAATARRLEQALAAEIGDDLGEWLRDRSCCSASSLMVTGRSGAAVHQYAQGVVGITRPDAWMP